MQKFKWRFNVDFFRAYTGKFLRVYVFQLTIFWFFRLLFLFTYGHRDNLKAYFTDILKAFYWGFKFDTSVIFYGMLIPVLATLILSFFKQVNRARFNRFLWIYFWIASFIYAVFGMIDYYFYGYFQSHISPVIFGLRDDKTSAVLVSLWSDYPVVKILFVMLVFLWVSYKILKIIILKDKENIRFRRNGLFFVSFLVIYFLGLRGTVSMFPLRINHTTVSPNTFVNDLVLNGVFAFKITLSFAGKSKGIDPEKFPKPGDFGFASEREALSVYFNKPQDAVKSFDEEMFAFTPKDTFLENHPPHVVFVLIESFSRHYMDLSREGFDLLGSLKEELPHLIVLKNFTSSWNLTIQSLENILVSTPVSPISQSRYAGVSFSSSVALPFRQAGYHTLYLTGDRLGWRNSGVFIRNQYFDEVLGLSYLEKQIPDLQTYEWGAFDEYLYEEIFDRLSHARQPLFIFTLTVGNHTPYALPPDYTPPAMDIPPDVSEKLQTSLKTAKENFIAYRYTADQLGKFIRKIRRSPLGKNTIIVATGDHNERGMFRYSPGELFLKRSVPLIIYLPEDYRKHIFVDTMRFGSHKDIFPTVFHLALSHARYFRSGEHLLDSVSHEGFGVNAFHLAAKREGAVYRRNGPLYFKWSEAYRILQPSQQDKTLQRLDEKSRAYEALLYVNLKRILTSSTANAMKKTAKSN